LKLTVLDSDAKPQDGNKRDDKIDHCISLVYILSDEPSGYWSHLSHLRTVTISFLGIFSKKKMSKKSEILCFGESRNLN